MVKLKIHVVKVEFGRSCKFDKIDVYDGSHDSASLLARLCGYRIQKIIFSSGNALFVSFQTDRSRAYKGFKITYTAVSRSKYYLCDNHELFVTMLHELITQ